MQDNLIANLVLFGVLAVVLPWSWSRLKNAANPRRRTARAWLAWFVLYAAGTALTLQWLVPALHVPHNILTVSLICVVWVLVTQAWVFGRR